MSLNPAIRACENPYSRWWYNGWLVGLLTGVALSTVVAYVTYWVGWLSI